MKKIITLIVASLLFAIPSFSQDDEDYFLEVDEYLGQAVETVEAVLGEPNEDDVSTIYQDFKNDSVIDPDYSMYFPKDELAEGVKVRVLVWDDTDICSIVWAKQDKDQYGDWRVFTSLAHDDKIHF